MTDQAMSPLRRRMIEDMTIRKFAPKTQHDYLQRVKNFTIYLGRSPDTASAEDVRRYQLHLTARGGGVPTLNQTVSTLRFFFKVTLGRADLVERTAFVREQRKLPVVLSPEEVGAPARCGAGAQIQSSAERGLRGGITRLRGGGAEDRRYRQQAHGHSRRARQRPQLRRLSTGNDHARRRAALDNRLVGQSPLRDTASAYRDRPVQPATPSTASKTGVQCTSATDRQRRNPHSV